MNLYQDKDAKFIVLFAPKEIATEAQRILVQNGFVEVPAPVGNGMPGEQIKKLDEEYDIESKAAEEATKKIEELRKKHAAFILASDEQLSIDVEKAETPLRLGATAHAFALDGWVPSVDVPTNPESDRREAWGYRFPGGNRGRAAREHHEPTPIEGVGHEEPKAIVPTKQRNGKTVKRLSTLPAYLHPTLQWDRPDHHTRHHFPDLLWAHGRRHGLWDSNGHIGGIGPKEMHQQGLAYHRYYAILRRDMGHNIRVFLFGEAFGLHFALRAGDLTWSSLLGLDIPNKLFGVIPIGIYDKLGDAKMLLFIAIWIGMLHLAIGLGLGFYNKTVRHSFEACLHGKVQLAHDSSRWSISIPGFARHAYCTMAVERRAVHNILIVTRVFS